MEFDQCQEYFDSLDLPTPKEIMYALLGHAAFHYNMSGAGVLESMDAVPTFLNSCDQHQVEHLTKFSECLTVVTLLSDSPTQVIREKFHEVREAMDSEFVASQVKDVSFEEVFFGGSSEEGISQEGNPQENDS